MKSQIAGSPFEYNALEKPREGLIKQELITYEYVSGSVIKTTVSRKFYKEDYTDSQSKEVIYTVTQGN